MGTKTALVSEGKELVIVLVVAAMDDGAVPVAVVTTDVLVIEVVRTVLVNVLVVDVELVLVVVFVLVDVVVVSTVRKTVLVENIEVAGKIGNPQLVSSSPQGHS